VPKLPPIKKVELFFLNKLPINFVVVDFPFVPVIAIILLFVLFFQYIFKSLLNLIFLLFIFLNFSSLYEIPGDKIMSS